MNFKDKIINFLSGRYGYDELNRFLLVLYAIIIIINLITRLYWLNIIGAVVLIILLFRILSKNREKRSLENRKFMKMIAPLRIWFSNIQNSSKSDHKLFICPNCKQTVRVPKGKGRIEITCPKCSNKFIKRS